MPQMQRITAIRASLMPTKIVEPMRGEKTTAARAVRRVAPMPTRTTPVTATSKQPVPKGTTLLVEKAAKTLFVMSARKGLRKRMAS